ncbi:acyltransferase domain-containing protein [Streptomyces sp. NPDC002577]
MAYTAIQFPGLGGYSPGVFQHLASEGAVSTVLREVDQAARDYGLPPVSTPLTDPAAPDIEDLAKTPTRLHLASLATGLALHGALKAHARGGDVLLGHSTGELTALAAAGCLSAYDAARVLCEREIALAEGDFGGGLTALRMSARRAENLCGAVGGWSLQPSLFNAPQQTVVSGSTEELPRLERAARALGTQATRLLVVYPHHNPMLSEAARQVAEATARYRLTEPHIRVFSPLLGRWVRSVADVRRIIDRHLTDPVDYLGAIRELHANSGVGTFLEAGPRPLLTECAAESLPPDVKLVGPPPGASDARKILDTFLQSVGPEAGPLPRRVAGTAPWDAELARPAARIDVSAEQVPAVANAPSSGRVMAVGAPVDSGRGAALPGRDELVLELRQVFAEALGYPPEVLTEDAHLEADLGVASVKKTEILVELLDRYDLPTPPADLRVRDYNTLPKLADLMMLLAATDDEAGNTGGAVA